MGELKRHCWECRRRCLVCDFTTPGCNRCSASGTECPGYSDVKPTRLKWLAPGKVKSRTRRRKLSDKRHDQTVKTPATDTTELYKAVVPLYVQQFEMRNDVCGHLHQATEYFNACIYADLVPIHELGQNSHIFPISTTHLHQATTRPNYVLFGMLCMTLSHRINQMRGESQYALIERFHHYWGLAIRSLNEHIGMEDTRTGDMVIAGILTLLLVDVQQGTSLNWRYHLEGVHKVIELRGGIQTVATSQTLEPLLLCLWSISVFGNATSPVSGLIMTRSQLDNLEFMVGHFSAAISPLQMCPLPLFGEMIRINHVRMRAASNTRSADDLFQKACEILERIYDFSPENWAKSKPTSAKEWLLLGNIYQTAATLYCILSLQSLSVFPSTPSLRASCTASGKFLQLLLSEGLRSPRIKRFLIWPLVVLGVEATHGGAEMRGFVAGELPELSRSIGTYAPITAKHVLESFWCSGEKSWDACFDRPYTFTSQIAVDTSHIS